MPTRAFNQIQYTHEATPGTDSSGTKDALIGNLSVTPTQTIHHPSDTRKSLAQNSRDTVVGHGMQARYTGDATYEQIIQWLAMVVKGGVTPSTSDTTAKTWTYLQSLISSNAQDGMTLTYGDDNQAFQSKFVMATALEITFAPGQPLQLSVDLFGHPPQKDTFDGSGTEFTTPNVIKSDGAVISIDTTWSNLGTSTFGSMLVGGTIRLESGLTPTRYVSAIDANSEIVFSAVKENKRTHNMQLDFVTTSDWEAEVYDAWKARTDRAIRIVFTDAALAGNSSAKYAFTIDMHGRFEEVGELYGEHNGENMARATFNSYDNLESTPGDLKVVVVNKEAAYQT